ncbi:MAG: hypothetical protein V8Q30_11485 [Acutalibacteraceae bacterium]
MAFLVLALSQVVQAYNMRSEHSLFKIGPFSNQISATSGAGLSGADAGSGLDACPDCVRSGISPLPVALRRGARPDSGTAVDYGAFQGFRPD